MLRGLIGCVDYILIFTIKLFQILSSRGSSIIREIKRILTHTHVLLALYNGG